MKKPVTFTIEQDVLKKGQKKAIDLNTSFGDYLESLLIKDLK